MLITAIRLGGLEVKTLYYQPMDPRSSPGEGKKMFFFFHKKNAKIYRRIYASMACKGLILCLYTVYTVYTYSHHFS